MAEMNFEQVLAAVRQLPIEEQRKLSALLAEETKPQVKKPLGRRAPLPVPHKDRRREYEWLAEHSRDYAGQWVALEGKQLIAHSFQANDVFKAADEAGIERPFLVRVEDPDAMPFAGW